MDKVDNIRSDGSTKDGWKLDVGSGRLIFLIVNRDEGSKSSGRHFDGAMGQWDHVWKSKSREE
jgi:hypothetical protein